MLQTQENWKTRWELEYRSGTQELESLYYQWSIVYANGEMNCGRCYVTYNMSSKSEYSKEC